MLVNALYESPGAVIPVVLERLRQREKLAKQVRTQLDEKWRARSKQNYWGSLDYSSAAQKAKDEALYSDDSLLMEDRITQESEGIVHTYSDLETDAYVLPLVKQLSSAADVEPVQKWYLCEGNDRTFALLIAWLLRRLSKD